jgi:uncharacterized protein YkwD
VLCTGVASAATDGRAISSASCDDTHLVPTRSNGARIEAATLCLVNVQRARHGERALRPNADLGRSAAAHSQDMVARNYFAEFRDSGLGVVARAPQQYVHGQRGATYTQQFGAVTRR